MRGPGELTAETSQLLALKSKLQVQLGDHHDQDVIHISRSKKSELGACCPLSSPAQKKRIPRKFPGDLSLMQVPWRPLGQGPEQTSKGQRPVWLTASSGDRQLLLTTPCRSGSLTVAACQLGAHSARKAHCSSAVTLTVSSSLVTLVRLDRDRAHVGQALVSAHAKVSCLLHTCDTLSLAAGISVKRPHSLGYTTRVLILKVKDSASHQKGSHPHLWPLQPLSGGLMGIERICLFTEEM